MSLNPFNTDFKLFKNKKALNVYLVDLFAVFVCWASFFLEVKRVGGMLLYPAAPQIKTLLILNEAGSINSQWMFYEFYLNFEGYWMILFLWVMLEENQSFVKKLIGSLNVWDRIFEQIKEERERKFA